ncbi:unnamed protein product [Orchesella dallaii]|uniref:CRC domain-containing protein n=1 Tax=Orchesella dallaii TaxID=48710 RepID=A0ABP1QVS6_9HEXA
MADQEIQEQPAQPQLKEEYYQLNTADGNTIVLSSEQLKQMQDDGMIAPEQVGQQYVEEILGEEGEEVHGQEEMVVDHGDPNGEIATQQIHIDADGNIVTASQMHDLVTFHSMDAQGNIITQGAEDGVEMTEQVEIPMDQSGMENMMETENIVEEVIASTNPEEEEYLTPDNVNVNNDINQQFLNVQEAIFNPETGTLQPINAVTTAAPVSVAPVATPKPIKKVIKPNVPQQQVVTKYVLQQTGGDLGQGQTIIMDPSQLQGIIQGGGSITLGAGGKNILLAPAAVGAPKQKPLAPKSPAKILPAPIPSGDQQQGTGPKLMIKQGNVLTPLNHPQEKYIAVSTGNGNQIQYLRVVQGNKHIAPSNKIAIAPANIKPKPVAPKPGPGQAILLPAGSTAADVASLHHGTPGLGNIVVLPNYVQVKTESSGPIPIRPAEPHPSVSSSSLTDANALLSGLTSSLPSGGNNLDSIRSLLEPNGMRPRKPCNCTKSQCLKLYCDCFANGEFCHLCNCTNCFNNLQHEEDRQKAIKLVLERNPGAFRPKIGKSSQTGEAHERRHNKGCNCRRSGCLKNYCECYEAKIFCSGICKCTGCKNCIENIPTGLPNGVGVEQHFAGAGTAHRQTLKDLAEAAEVRVQQQNQVKNKMRAQMQEVSAQNNLGIMVPPIVFRYPNSTISYEVVTATVELLLAKAEACEKQRMSEGEIEREVLEEFGDCLASVMELGSSVD